MFETGGSVSYIRIFCHITVLLLSDDMYLLWYLVLLPCNQFEKTPYGESHKYYGNSAASRLLLYTDTV